MTDKKFLRRIKTNVYWTLSESASRPVASGNVKAQSLTEYLGYDRLFSLSIPLTDVLEEQWRCTRTVFLPMTCCVCSRKGEILLPCFEYSFFGRRSKAAVMNNVPHCAEHALAGVAKFCCVPLSPYAPHGDFSALLLIGKDREFLREAGRMNRVGDIRPPWITFPGVEPWSGFWRQGSGEGWLDGCWRPFYSGLDATQQEDYLNKWQAPEEWEDCLRRKLS